MITRYPNPDEPLCDGSMVLVPSSNVIRPDNNKRMHFCMRRRITIRERMLRDNPRLTRQRRVTQ